MISASSWAEQMLALGVEGDIVLEPERRDSAAAVAVGALMAAHRAKDASCVILASDHVIDDDAAFVSDWKLAQRAARSGRIMTLGIAPTSPSPAYGYIAVGEPLGEKGAFVVDRFVEKPDVATARTYVAQGMLWNSGNFLFSPAVMLEELAQNAPAVLAAARDALDNAARDLDFLRLDAARFCNAPKISIDYAVMEKTSRAGRRARQFRLVRRRRLGRLARCLQPGRGWQCSGGSGNRNGHPQQPHPVRGGADSGRWARQCRRRNDRRRGACHRQGQGGDCERPGRAPHEARSP
jgi:hypothetical protein